MILGRVDLKWNEGDSWVDYMIELMSMINIQSLFFSLWSYQVLNFSVLEFKMNSDMETNWALNMCRRKKITKSKATRGSAH